MAFLQSHQTTCHHFSRPFSYSQPSHLSTALHWAPSHQYVPVPFPIGAGFLILLDELNLFLSENMEFVDDISTFQELGLSLKSHGCHVANLSSFDFSSKNGIAGCLTSLLRQFLVPTFDVHFLIPSICLSYLLLYSNLFILSFNQAADMSILASWYSQQGNCGSPVVVIIDDMERCCGAVLSDFILMLRYYNPKPHLCVVYCNLYSLFVVSLTWACFLLVVF